MRLRLANERGQVNFGWLHAQHSFSFGSYYDPNHMGFSELRVINDDRIAGGRGFDTHPHRDMEIISYIVEGALEHKDSMGNGSVIKAGDVQYMSAGKGVLHSERNPSAETTRLLQIWIMPDKTGYAPRYADKHFSEADKTGQWRLIASPDGSDGSIAVRQDTRIFASVINENTPLEKTLDVNRSYWLQVVNGQVTVNGQTLNEGDALAINEPADTDKVNNLNVSTTDKGEFLLFDLPK